MDRFHWFCYCRTEGCLNSGNANYIITDQDVPPNPTCAECLSPITEIILVEDPNTI